MKTQYLIILISALSKKIFFLRFCKLKWGKIIRKHFYLTLILLLSFPIAAQNLQVGFGWGLVNFQNNIVERKDFNLLEYKVSGDYRYSFLLKYEMAESNIRFKGGYFFSEINGNGSITDVEPNLSSEPINVSTENSLATIALGLEYVIEEKTFKPYLGVDFLLGIFDDVDVFYSEKTGMVREVFPSQSRIGLGLSGGISYELIPGMNLDINIVYSSLNLLGKESYEDHIITTDLTVFLLFVL